MTLYEIKAVETIAGGPGVLVREFTFAPGEATPWHRHSQMTDRCYGLSGRVTLERRDAPPVELQPGLAAETPTGVLHRLVNHGAADGRVLLVQTGGRYDFLAED
ncbi:MAG TPA: cupin domain-containing protein [Phenylobacterium sp.]|nr:cupin domain-containing protein [Phenylobacterium sp.]